MSEFLHGVLEENCQFSEFAVYSIEIVCPASPPAQLTGFLRLKGNRSFLLMGARCVLVGANNLITSGGTNNFELFDPRTSYTFTPPPMLTDFFGDNLNAPFTWPVYPFFEKSGMIGARVYRDGVPTITAGNRITFSLYGIEYGE